MAQFWEQGAVNVADAQILYRRMVARLMAPSGHMLLRPPNKPDRSGQAENV